VEDVRYIEAAGNYARLHTAEGRHAVRETMQHLEDSLDPTRFLRIHRSYLVNLDAVLEIRHLVKDDLAVHLRGGETLPLSRAFRARLEARLGERT
jgi:DNA-binding LytR/AlgR family response regulator